jgi:hypothetical protein
MQPYAHIYKNIRLFQINHQTPNEYHYAPDSFCFFEK